MRPKRIAILGSTGSVGRQALDLIRDQGELFQVVALTAGKNVDLLARQAREFRPLLIACGDPARAGQLRERCGNGKIHVQAGPEGLRAAATLPEADLVLACIVGAAGLESTFAAVRAGKSVALANKEALVMAGGLMIDSARERGAKLLPVDSEHSALHQCLRGEKRSEVARLVLTASGGPFFRSSAAALADVTPEAALRHPTWKMGPKITIDSATLMNKGLEVIEAHWLFAIPEERISIVVHPQSIVHSLVEFVDGSWICQMGVADMRFPIQYALSHPDRMPSRLQTLRLEELPPLEFLAPDPARFPCPGLARDAIRAGGTAPAVLNAANEVAVDRFLHGGIPFPAIPQVIQEVLEQHEPRPVTGLEDIMAADRKARDAARAAVERRT
ncbi:MAG: 1-deoxy-D-xylulose-5-phosphate reductoisomerase [Acidobacteria bacterium]|nr:1-deoxy-D-xylulose-5-phosphate reductoisomerase [Acidobacteriota bacterium]